MGWSMGRNDSTIYTLKSRYRAAFDSFGHFNAPKNRNMREISNIYSTGFAIGNMFSTLSCALNTPSSRPLSVKLYRS